MDESSKLIHLKNELRTYLQCPTECAVGTRLESLSDNLYWLWEQISSKYAYDYFLNNATQKEKENVLLYEKGEDFALEKVTQGESEFEEAYELLKNELVVEDDEIEGIDGGYLGEYALEIHLATIDTVEEAERELESAKTWIDDAKREFNQYSSIIKCEVASWETYKKHYPLGSESISEVRQKTSRKGSPSLFYPGVTPENLDWVLVSAMEDCFWSLIKLEKLRIAVDCLCVVGASKGEDTRHIFYEFNRSSKVAHAYPVLLEDIPSDVLLTNCDSLQGCVDLP